MKLTPQQKEGLLSVVKGVLPRAEWAPEESWLEDGVGKRRDRKEREAVFFEPLCFCQDRSEAASLTLFLKSPLLGEHYNIISRLERVVRAWALSSLKWEGCGTCHNEISIDVRLFRTDPVVREVDILEEVE